MKNPKLVLTLDYRPFSRVLEFTDLTERQINMAIMHAINCRERDGEFPLKISVTEVQR